MDLDQLQQILAQDLHEGDLIVNVGTITAPIKAHGAFVMVDVMAEVWSPVTGLRDHNRLTLTLHSVDTVVIVPKDQD